ncbi:tigger transposable element-derived protein 1-like [Centruroides vittatus]|uniref:tigger transposable element-derived protein 1-like n=1 Tax=Centruroides vittatus TaxID=120091 RepID=UPI00350EB893
MHRVIHKIYSMTMSKLYFIFTKEYDFIIKPLDQEIISTFKTLYIKRAFTHILEQMENYEFLTLINAWKSFTILECVKNIALSYTAIKQSMLNGCWKKLWPDVVKGKASISPLKGEYSQIVQLADSLNGESLDDFTEEDIAELVADKELSKDDLINMVDETSDCDNDPDEEEFESVAFTAKVVHEGLELGSKLGNHSVQNDSNVERAFRFQRNINHCLAQYNEIYKDLTRNQKQMLITDFITKFPRAVNVSTSNIKSAQIISTDESDLEPVTKKRLTRMMRATHH